MSYKARTTAPSSSNKYYKHTSAGGVNECIHIKNGSVLPNCVGYAWGRVYEITGKRPKLSRRNAELWFGYTADGYVRGTSGKDAVPKLGAVVCWRKGTVDNGSDGAGHVAIIEDYDDTYVYLSESNYKGTRWKTRKVKRSTMYLGKNYTFQGYIYHEGCEEKVVNKFFPTKGYFALGDRHENVGKIAEFMYKTFPAYTTKQALGNYYGKNIQKSITEFQKRSGLKADGKFGPLTLAKLKKYGFDE